MKKLGDALAGQNRPRPTAGRGRSGQGSGASAEAPGAEATGRAADPPVCPVCRGAGWLKTDVPFGHPSFGRIFQCECLAGQIEGRRASELMRFSALDPFRDKTFESFDPRVTGADRAFELAKRYSRDPKDWLILIGPYGCGKTHLAAAIANEAIQRGNQALFAVVPDLLDHLRSTFSPSSDVQYDELFERVRTAGLLILDDLGTESATPWAREKLYQIINYRYNYQQPTVITTNRRMNEIDDRIRSRMTDQAFCTVVEIAAEDYRQRRPGERRRLGPAKR